MKNSFILIIYICLFTLVSMYPQINDPVIIKSISMDRENIFSEQNFFYNIVNFLHINTAEYTIKKYLLVKEGELYDSLAIYESAKNLRQLKYVGETEIETFFDCIDSVSLNIKYKEKWSTQLGFSFEKSGSYYKYESRFKENNLLGFGSQLAISYSKDNKGIQKDISFSENNLLGSFIDLTFQHRDYIDWRANKIIIIRDIYSAKSDYLFRLFHEGFNGIKYFSNNPFIPSQYKSYIFSAEALKLINKSNGFFLKAGASYDKKGLTRKSLIERKGISAGIGKINVNYLKTNGFNGIMDNETLQIGHSIGLVSGINFGNPSSYIEIDVKSALFSYPLYMYHYLKYHQEVKSSKKHYNFESIYLYKLNHSSLVLKLMARGGLGQDFLNYFDRSYFRGFQNEIFYSDHTALLNFEYRIFNLLRFWRLSFGLTFFGDFGILIFNEVKPSASEFYKAIGCGLRIENSILSFSNVLRMDYAFNINSRDFILIITSNQFFNAIGILNVFN